MATEEALNIMVWRGQPRRRDAGGVLGRGGAEGTGGVVDLLCAFERVREGGALNVELGIRVVALAEVVNPVLVVPVRITTILISEKGRGKSLMNATVSMLESKNVIKSAFM